MRFRILECIRGFDVTCEDSGHNILTTEKKFILKNVKYNIWYFYDFCGKKAISA